MNQTMPGQGSTRKASCKTGDGFRPSLLAWYDRYSRDLPWRAKGGKRADPYHVWLSEVMLQQTTVQAVIPYFVKFVDKWPEVRNLAEAEDDDVMQAWAGLGYYARARNLLKCARAVSQQGGAFPESIEELRSLPGIGEYTSAAIAAIAFDSPATVIDGNVDRVVSRYFAISDPLPDSKPQIRAHAERLYKSGECQRPGDFAQAMMDLGATICTPSQPKCGLCPVADGCLGFELGIAATLPVKKPKPERAKRKGYIYWVEDARGRILLQKRPEQGLLGGMTGFPTSEWVNLRQGSKKWPKIEHIFDTCGSNNVFMKQEHSVHHVFTHFSLELKGISILGFSGSTPGPEYFWVDKDEIRNLGFPTVFKKFLKIMMPQIATNRSSA